MKKRNVILHTAIASALLAMGVSAQAGGTLSQGTPFVVATQNFGATSLASAEIIPTAVTYTYSTSGGIVLNNNGAIVMYLRLANGATFTAAPAVGDISGTVVTGLLLTKTSVALSTDKTTIAVTLTNSTGGNVTIGVGATMNWTPAAGRAVTGVNSTLATAGNTIGLTGSASVLAAAPNSATLPADIDGPATATTTIATAASAYAGTVTAGGTTAETQKIDVTASPTQTIMTTGVNSASTTIINFGSFAFTDATTPAKLADNSGTYNVGAVQTALATSTGAVATGNFAAAGVTGGNGSMKLGTNNGCTTPTTAGSIAVLSASNTIATWTGVTTAASAAPTYVCMTVSTTAGKVVAIPVTTPTIVATLAPVAATGANTTASGTLYALGLNGASIDVRSYVPAAATGYSSFVRIVNSGTGSAPISVAVIDQTTGVPGTSFVLGTLAGGAAKTYLASDIEAVTGALAATARPRLRITAPTSSLQVQSFMSSPNGVFSDMSGGQLYNPTPAGTVTGN